MNIEQLDRIFVFFLGFMYGLFIFFIPKVVREIKESLDEIKKDSAAGTDESDK